MTYIESKPADGIGSTNWIPYKHELEAGKISMADIPVKVRASEFLSRASALSHDKLDPEAQVNFYTLAEKLYMLTLSLNEKSRRQTEREALALGSQIPPDLKAELEGLRDYFFNP